MNNENPNIKATEITDADAEKVVGGATERIITVYDFAENEVYRHNRLRYYYHVWMAQKGKSKSDHVEIHRFFSGEYRHGDLIHVECRELIEDCTFLGVRDDYQNL